MACQQARAQEALGVRYAEHVEDGRSLDLDGALELVLDVLSEEPGTLSLHTRD